MKPPEKEIPRSRRPRTLPPPASQAESTLPPMAEPDVHVPRFYDQAAQLAALAAQVRTLTQTKDKAVAAGRLARQLVHHGIEMRDALALGEKSLAILFDPDLGLDVARWWCKAGDSDRGASLAESVVDELPEEQRCQALLGIAKANITLGKSEPAVRALRRVIDLKPEDPTPNELFGALGFWSEVPRDECARAFLRAADIRRKSGDESNAFESRLKAFEVDAHCTEAAAALSSTLRARGRSGAADEILREHLRTTSSAQRAAHHQRAFYSSLAEESLENCIESALEAELDIDLDVDRVHSLVLERAPLRQDFESFLWSLVSNSTWGQSNMLASWLLSLCEVHRGRTSDAKMAALERCLVEEHDAMALPFLDSSDNDDKIRRLRTQLVGEFDANAQSELRLELTRRLCLKADWEEALLVLAPLLDADEVSLVVAAFGAALGGRTSNPLVRVRAMIALSPMLPPPAAAVTYAVAAERLLHFGQLHEARQAADAAVEALPTNERAIATQALVALRAPDGASAFLLEHSLSVLVARSDACSLLSEAASQRGASHLALTWAARALALRPGDVACARGYLQQACSLLDPDKIIEAVDEVLDHPVPVLQLESDVCDCLTLLMKASPARLTSFGLRILAIYSAHNPNISTKLHEVARAVGATELLASLTEARLIYAEPEERGPLFCELSQHRLDSGQMIAAARAIRRAQLAGMAEEPLRALRARFETVAEPDARLALYEFDAHLKEGLSARERSERLFLAGCARWDMAHDTEQAIQLWMKAADFDEESGLALFAHYLRNMAGSEAAARHLKIAAKSAEDPVRSGRLLGLAAREMLRLGKHEKAFRLASAALERAPLLADLLAIAEVSVGEATLPDLDRLYQLLADGALGNFGQRAVHYRAARQLEKRGALDLALTHACAAFEAEPAEGVAYVLMARLAEATAGHHRLLSSLQKVADLTKSDAERARWLSLAAALSDTESIGRGERLEILFRAATMQPEFSILENLFDGIAHCLADEPDSRDELWERFAKLAREVFSSSTGPKAARNCLLFSVTAVTHFEQPDFAVEALAAAAAHDLAVEDYRRLLPFVHQLAGIVGPAGEFVEFVRGSVERKWVELGKEAAALTGSIAELLGDRDVRAELFVRSACRFPEDASLVEEARRLANESGRKELVSLVDELLPVRDRTRALMSRLDRMSSEEALDAILELDVALLDEVERRKVLEEKGRRLEDIGRLEDAVESYRALLELDENSQVALLGLERHAETHGNDEDLLQILGRRIELSDDPGEMRRLTLRRAAVLETKLGRAPEARKLLQSFLGEGEDRAALRLLADSWQRTGDHTEAAELWERVHSVALDSIEADDAAYRAASCFYQAGQPRRAKNALSNIAKPVLHHLELGLEVARASGDKDGIYSAIVRLCDLLVGDHERHGRLLLEAAQLALAKKRLNDAQRCADQALRLIPDVAEAKLLVARIRAQNGALSTTLQAEEMTRLLSGTESFASATDREMAAFLRAKSLILSGHVHQAQQLLEAAIEDQGERPLLCGLLSETLEGEDERALRLIDVALGGQCHGFFSEGDLLLRAGALAQNLGDFDRARGLISAVADDDPLRVRAARALEELSFARTRKQRKEREQGVEEGDSSQEEDTEVRVRPETADQDASRGTDLAQSTTESEQQAQGRHDFEPKYEPETSIQTELASTVEEIRRAAREEHRNAARAASEHQELTGPLSHSGRQSRRRSSRPALRAVVAATLTQEEEDSLKPPLVPDFDDENVASSPSLSGKSGGSTVSDQVLLVRLEAGDVEAGLELLGRLREERGRSRDAVIVAQHLSLLNPADAQLLGGLVTAAYRDGNEALAQAARHVLGAYGVGEDVSAPPLDQVLDQGGVGQTLLRQVHGPANEALGIVWEHAHGFFRRELSDYGISGLERVAFHAPNLISRLSYGVSRVTGLIKTPVFRSAGSEEISIQVALVQPPAVIVSGEVEELSLELMYHFGAMMAACSPEHALVFGASHQDVQSVLSALSLSFGAGRADNRERPPAEVTRVASFLWESVPTRAQRRLSQLCADPAELTYTALSGHSRLAVRRAGLIACGDLPTAIDDACAECGLAPPRTLTELASVVQSCPAALDLFQLSLSSEYAQIRFLSSH